MSFALNILEKTLVEEEKIFNELYFNEDDINYFPDDLLLKIEKIERMKTLFNEYWYIESPVDGDEYIYKALEKKFVSDINYLKENEEKRIREDYKRTKEKIEELKKAIEQLQSP